MLYVSRSRSGRGGLTHFSTNFCDTQHEAISDLTKDDTKLDQPISVSIFCDTEQEVISHRKKNDNRSDSGSQVPSGTSRHRPPTALKLGSESS